ncbi:MAG: alpha/beta hydrolase, partial [Burkholderiaceae bacterium]
MPPTQQTFLAPQRRNGRLQRPDCEIYYEVTGSGPAIVFMHGLGGNHLSWWQQVAHFAPRFTCVTFAHRGFAPSSPLADGPNPADYADDLAALLDHLALDKVWLVGQSMGGWTGVEYTLRNTGSVRGLVLANTTGTLDARKLSDALRTRFDAWMIEADATAMAGFANGVHPACGERMAREQPALHLLYRHIDDMAGKMDKQAIRARLFDGRTRAPQDLAAVACPVLFIVGQEDIV